MKVSIVGLGMNKEHLSIEALHLLETATYIMCIEERSLFPYYEE